MQSLASLLLTDSSQLPELKEQLARFLSAITSFRRGREYLLSVGQGRQLLYETSMALKGRRVVGNAVEYLLAALQKLSIRPTAQKELLLNGKSALIHFPNAIHSMQALWNGWPCNWCSPVLGQRIWSLELRCCTIWP